MTVATRLRGGNALGPRRGKPRRPGRQDRPGLRLHRDDRRADGLRLLRRRRDRGDPPQRRPVLGHRAGKRAAIRAAITTIPEDAWQPIEYPQAVWMTSWAAWLAIAAITHNLVRAAGALAGRRHARARAATIRGDLIAVAARTARHGRGRLTIHLPEGWHREHEWLNLWEAACGPPAAAA